MVISSCNFNYLINQQTSDSFVLVWYNYFQKLERHGSTWMDYSFDFYIVVTELKLCEQVLVEWMVVNARYRHL